MKKFILLFAALLMQVSALAQSVYATNYVYVPGQGMVEVESSDSDTPRQVDNDGLFGMRVEDFRAMCSDTGGAWDVVNGRHKCWCDDEGEFNYPYGCPAGGLTGEVPPELTPELTYPQEDPNYNDPYYNDPYYNDPNYVDPNYTDPTYTEEYNPYAPVLLNYDEVPYYWDLSGHWSEGYVAQLTIMGILQGYPDGSFRPNAPISRAEMLKMTMMAAGVYPVPGDEDRNKFFSDLDNWQAAWVNAAYRMDIVEGYSGPYSGVRLYKPNNNVNRAEGVKLVLASFGRQPWDYDQISYTDVKGWMIPWVEDAFQIGLIGNEPNRRFKPAEALTRAEAAKIIVKMLEYSGDL